MNFTSDNQHLFSESDMSSVLRGHLDYAQVEVDKIPDGRFQDSSDEELVAQLKSEMEIQPLVLHKEQKKIVEQSEPELEIAQAGRTVRARGLRLVLAIPYTGIWQLWTWRPSAARSDFPRGRIHDGPGLRMVIEGLPEGNEDEIGDLIDENIQKIEYYLQCQARDLQSFNHRIVEKIREAIRTRRARLDVRAKILRKLDIPVSLDGEAALVSPEEAPLVTPEEAPPVPPEEALPVSQGKKDTLGSREKALEAPSGQANGKGLSHVFISYVQEDEAAANQLAKILRGRGLEVWLDRDSIAPGKRWKQEIRKAIQDGAFFIACFSAEYSKRDSTYMNEELTIAIEVLRQRPMNRSWFIPLILSECQIPDRDIGAGESLRDIQWLDLSRDWDLGVEKLSKALLPDILDSRTLSWGATHWTQPLMYRDHTGQTHVRVFEIDIHNRDYEQGALNAIARLKQIIGPDGALCSDIDRSRLKVVGQQSYSQTILPRDHEAWDLFAVRMDISSTICLNSALDVVPRRPIISLPGEYVLTYEIRAEHFPVLEFDIKLTVSDDDPQDTSAMLAT